MKNRPHAFTLAELLISTTVLGVILAALVPLMTFVVRTVAKTRAMADLETSALFAQEWIKHDLRRTARSEIMMYPSHSYTVDVDEEGSYTGNSICISFPVLNRDAEDTTLPLDASGAIQWNQTIIYHVSYNSDTNKYELRRTVFDPRDNSLDSYQRLIQLFYTWWYGEGSQSGYNEANAATRTLAYDVTNHLITSGITDIDAYHTSLDRQVVPVGTWVLNSGSHTLRFTTTGRNDNSSGYKIGLDQINISATGEPYDVECLLPAHLYNGPAPSSTSMQSYSGWRNNAAMLFPASNTNDYVEFEIHNDMWLESTFNFEKAVAENVAVTFDPEIGENVCRMTGNRTAWESAIQTIGTTAEATSGGFKNSTFRVIVGGSDSSIGGNIAYSGRQGKVTFRATPGSGKLAIEAAYIMKRDSGYNGSGTPVQLTFGEATGTAGATSIVIDSGTTATTDFFDLPISPDNDYLISFHLGDSATSEVGRPAIWNDTATTATHAYHIQHLSGSTADESGDADWSAYSSSVEEMSSIVAVDNIFVTYPATAVYTSRPMDTKLANPQFSSVSWRDANPLGTDIRLRVRSGDMPDMSDALSWSSAPEFTEPDGVNSLGTIAGGRYVQWQALFYASDPYNETARLRDVRLLWPGERRGVDVAVSLERNTDMGQFALTIGDRSPAPAALRMSFDIARDTFVGTLKKEFAVNASPRNK